MDQIVIYGAGNIGRQYYQFFESQHMEHLIYAFCDKSYAQIKKIGNVDVRSYESLSEKDIPFVIGMADVKEVTEVLRKDGRKYYINLADWIEESRIDNKERIKIQLAYRNITDSELRKAVRIYEGICPCCKKNTLFISKHYWLRDHYKCLFCGSIPRQRALMRVLEEEAPEWREKSIHESSPGGSTFKVLKKNCKQYTYSYWYESKMPGEILGEHVTNQNLENLTFEDEIFDIFITQDVLEHVNYPEQVFREIARTLKKGGIHIFTTPIYTFRKTVSRIRMEGNVRKNILPPIYHGNPISSEGSLVTYEWGGIDFLQMIDEITGMESKIMEFPNSKENFENGLEGDFLQVIVSKKI